VVRPAADRDNGGVDCDACREALSARMDGELLPGSPDEHVLSCPACQDWYAAARALDRKFTGEPGAPDVTAAVLDRIEPKRGLLGATRWRPRRSG
jgi:predicted anti-sigma-YlaC factor YlaD